MAAGGPLGEWGYNKVSYGVATYSPYAHLVAADVIVAPSVASVAIASQLTEVRLEVSLTEQ